MVEIFLSIFYSSLNIGRLRGEKGTFNGHGWKDSGLKKNNRGIKNVKSSVKIAQIRF